MCSETTVYRGATILQIHLSTLLPFIRRSRRFFPPGAAAEIWEHLRYAMAATPVPAVTLPAVSVAAVTLPAVTLPAALVARALCGFSWHIQQPVLWYLHSGFVLNWLCGVDS